MHFEFGCSFCGGHGEVDQPAADAETCPGSSSFGLLGRLFHSRASLLIENLVLRQQLAIFKRKHSKAATDRT